MRLPRAWSISACGVVTAVLAGCGPEKVKHPDTVPAAGIVTYKGAPVAGAMVSLISAESKESGWMCTGKTDSAGKFSITTAFTTGTFGNGIPVGDYTAMVTKFESAALPPPVKDMKEYEAREKERQKAAAEGRNSADSAPKNLVPEKYAKEGTSGLKVKIEKAGNSNIEFKLED